jgi:putative acetyltransferase
MATPELIRLFTPADAPAFQRLNEEWIVRYFKIEPKDQLSLSDPINYILNPGGHILVAELNSEVIACCALLPLAPNEFEVAKMAVSEQHQGLGIGRRLLVATIAHAQSLGARRLYLDTNSILTPAIRLYESLGFTHLPPERVTPSPYARANVHMELLLPSATS